MGELFQPIHLVILCFSLALVLIPVVFYLLTLQNALNKCAPASRAMDPALVWLSLIPFFNLVWNFLVVMKVAKSLANEYARRGLPCPEPLPGQPIGIAMCVCACCSIIPILGLIALLANLVLWIMYWIKIAEYSRKLTVLPSASISSPSI